MRFAGVGWCGDRCVAAVLAQESPEPISTAAFPYDSDALLGWLSAQAEQAGGDLIVATDSTCGVLEGALLATGLPVHRFDPWDLPPTTACHRSADPLVLAETARSWPGLTAGGLASGWVADRVGDLLEGSLLSAEAEDELRRSDRFLSRGPRGRREIALTFDDGPDPHYTPQVLDVLARFGVVATFFCVGLNARAHPRILEAVATRGHVLANHTWSHPMLPDLSAESLAWQVEATGEAIARVVGQTPRLIRPPYGGRNPAVLEQLTDLDMTTVLWDTDATDWARPGVDHIKKTVVTRAEPGSVVLLHDSGGERDQTVAALPGIIECLLDDGYAFVSVGAMLRP